MEFAMLRLRYLKGTILTGEVNVPHSVWDGSMRSYRAMGMHYAEATDYLRNSGIQFSDEVLDLLPHSRLNSDVEPRPYQLEALDAWIAAGMRGTVVLPTGSGKTIVGILAIIEVGAPSIVVVPTIDLMEQWRSRLSSSFSQEVGAYGGGESQLLPLTVATYDTAYLRAEELGNRFKLIIFDEVHHLPSPGFSQIAEVFASPYRLGLTATYEREDGLHEDLARLIGPKVYEQKVAEMAGDHLAPFRIEKIYVDLLPGEDEEYRRNLLIYKSFLAKSGMVIRSPQDLKRLIMRSARDREAREALLAKNRAMAIALNSASKKEALKQILRERAGEKTLIFTQHNDLVYRLSKELLIPAITHETPKDERAEILSAFRSGQYRTIVTSKVLDEGIDVPDASLGIILSGTGSRREFVQRLGRLLRKVDGKEATLIEVVSRSTAETGVSSRRRRAI
ncbi:MAG: DEAD/DEAH box helicase family protein [Candidatus Methanomethylicia archaeon]|nr:DEAD/DEAH box helicase family protein [Candidatus Methanomethylicia archaeon]